MAYKVPFRSNYIRKKPVQDISDEVYKKIHTFIHGSDKSITINGLMYNKLVANNGCKSIEYNGIKFMEQNVNTSSLWAKQAQRGRKITWGIKEGQWILIVDNGEVLQK